MAMWALRSAIPSRASPPAWHWPSLASSSHGGADIGRRADVDRGSVFRRARRRGALSPGLCRVGVAAQRLSAWDAGCQSVRLVRARDARRRVRYAAGRVPAGHRVHGRLYDVLDVDGRERAARRGRRCCLAAAEPVAVDAGRGRHRRGGVLRGTGDRMISAGLKLDVYFGESLDSGRRMATDALMACFARHELEVAALYRG